MSFWTNNSPSHTGASQERMRIDASGNVGIGTPTPGAKLEVSGDARIGWISESKDGLWLSNSHTSGVYANSPFIQGVTSGFAPKNISLNPGGGNVGIGTTSPSEKLEVNGNILLGATWSGGSIHKILGDSASGYKSIQWHYDNLPSGTQIIDNNSIGFSVNSALRMKIISNGNVGIGTTSPNYKLEVNGTSHFTSEMTIQTDTYKTHFGYGTNGDIYLRSSENAGKVILQDTGGNVGIGTDSPSEKLEVVGTIKCSNSSYCSKRDSQHFDTYTSNGSTGSAMFLNWYSKSHVYISSIRFGQTGNNWGGGWYMQDDSWIRSYGNKALFIGGMSASSTGISTTGRVGIGTSSPDFPLHITSFRNGQYTGIHGEYYARLNATSWSIYGRYYDNHGTKNISLKTSYGIWNQGELFSTSDERIKENILDVSDNVALQQLRDISCCFYEYKDKVIKGTDKTIGFIAQQVRENMPMAVSIQKGIIPNEMRNIENPQWTTLTDASGNNTYKLTITDLLDASGNIKYRFYMSNDPSGNDECEKEITSLENDPKSFIFEEQWQNVFLYGKEVDDFHTLDKQKLFALEFFSNARNRQDTTAGEIQAHCSRNKTRRAGHKTRRAGHKTRRAGHKTRRAGHKTRRNAKQSRIC